MTAVLLALLALIAGAALALLSALAWAAGIPLLLDAVHDVMTDGKPDLAVTFQALGAAAALLACATLWAMALSLLA